MMKKTMFWSLLLGLGICTTGYAQTEGTSKSKQDLKKEAGAIQGELKYKTALEALKKRDFVWEFYNPKSTDKSRVCYNFIRVEGDKLFYQVAWSASGRSGEGFRQSEGTIESLTMTPDKKGNVKVYLKAEMTDIQSASRTTWTLTRTFKLFKGSNAAPWMGGWEGYIVLPSQSNAVELSGSMPQALPKGMY